MPLIYIDVGNSGRILYKRVVSSLDDHGLGMFFKYMHYLKIQMKELM